MPRGGCLCAKYSTKESAHFIDLLGSGQKVIALSGQIRWYRSEDPSSALACQAQRTDQSDLHRLLADRRLQTTARRTRDTEGGLQVDVISPPGFGSSGTT